MPLNRQIGVDNEQQKRGRAWKQATTYLVDQHRLKLRQSLKYYKITRFWNHLVLFCWHYCHWSPESAINPLVKKEPSTQSKVDRKQGTIVVW